MQPRLWPRVPAPLRLPELTPTCPAPGAAAAPSTSAAADASPGSELEMHFGSSSAAQQDTHPAGGSLTAPSPALEGSGGDDPAPCATPAAPVHPSAAAAAAASGPAAAAEAAAAAAGAADFDDDLDISAADLALMQELNIQVGVLRVLVCTHKNSLFHCTCRMLAHCTSRGRRPHSLTFKNANGVPSRRSCLRSRSISFSSCCWKRAGVAAVAPTFVHT